MSLNGVSDAFVHATASQDELRTLGRMMVGFSAAYVATALAGLSALGPTGLILANCTNTLLRSAYALHLIRRAAATASDDAAKKPAEAPPRMLPRRAVAVALVASAVLTSATGLWLGTPDSPPLAHAAHVLVGVACLAGVGASAWRTEPEILAELRSTMAREPSRGAGGAAAEKRKAA